MLVFKALESLMSVNGVFHVNVRVVSEGEEEAGGESIDRYVKTYPERLKCDVAFICDTHMLTKEIPTLINGLRGIIYTEVEVRGAKHDLHSGSCGGVAHNRVHALACIIAGLKDAGGHIHIPGLNGKLREASETEKAFWRDDPSHLNEELLKEMGVSEFSGEKEYPPLERIGARPTLEVHGIAGGLIGEGAKTVIPAAGKAKITPRLPPHLKPDVGYMLFARRVKEIAPAWG